MNDEWTARDVVSLILGIIIGVAIVVLFGVTVGAIVILVAYPIGLYAVRRSEAQR